jgi:serine/threonine-protein kinase HipA
MSVLHIYLEGEHMGELHQLETGQHAFEYTDTWVKDHSDLPLSLSMPVNTERYEGLAVTNFLNGLLPDNDDIRKRWGQRFGVSPNNPFALLSHIGQDCPGAIEIISERSSNEDNLTPLSEEDIGERLKELRGDASATRRKEDRGQFSLAGAQAKTAFHLEGEQWSLPAGSIPTTHILKPPVPGFEAQEANECFCLWLAANLGLKTTECFLQTFNSERAIVVKRFDRIQNHNGYIKRIHMEDLCQAFGVSPELKYQTDGGPSPEKILNLLEQCSYPEIDKVRFMGALFFNWLVLGTDAHAKNYSLMLLGKEGVALAPLYDISSYLPYADDPNYVSLAMKVMKKKKAGEIGRRHWEQLLGRVNMDVKQTMALLDDMLARFPETVLQTKKQALEAEMPKKFIEKLCDRMIDWSKQIEQKMQKPEPQKPKQSPKLAL